LGDEHFCCAFQENGQNSCLVFQLSGQHSCLVRVFQLGGQQSCPLQLSVHHSCLLFRLSGQHSCLFPSEWWTLLPRSSWVVTTPASYSNHSCLVFELKRKSSFYIWLRVSTPKTCFRFVVVYLRIFRPKLWECNAIK
jgi:hypothetical protein